MMVEATRVVDLGDGTREVVEVVLHAEEGAGEDVDREIMAGNA